MTENTFTGMSLADFTAVLASKEAVPGGGGAAALTGAVGAAAALMAASLTVGKKRYAAAEERVRFLSGRLEDARLKLLSLIDEDAAAFAPLSKAYGIKAETADEKERKALVMEAALNEAVSTPLAMMETISGAIDDAAELRGICARQVVSDADSAVDILKGALKAAAENVRVNTRLMADRDRAGKLDQKADELLRRAEEAWRLSLPAGNEADRTL